MGVGPQYDPKTGHVVGNDVGGDVGPVGADGLTDAQRKAQEAENQRRVVAGLPLNDTVEKINTSTGQRTYIPPGTPGPGGSPADLDLARARALAGHLSTLTNQPPRTAPQVAAAPTVTPGQAGPVTMGPVALPTASLATTPGAVTAPTMTAAHAMGAAPIGAPVVLGAQGGPAATYGASTVAPTAGATAGTATASQIAPGAQEEVRRQEMGLISGLQAAAAGTGGPSAAQAQMQKAVDQAIATQQSLVAGARGTGRIGASLRAGANIADITGRSAADSAILRAQEQAQARGELGQALTATRGADVTVGATNATLGNQVALQNAAGTTSVNISNADRLGAKSMKDADLQQAAAAGNAAAQNELNIRNAELRQGASISSAGMSLEAQKANQSSSLATALENARLESTAGQTNATLGLNAAQGNQNTALATALENARLGTSTNVAGAGFENAANLTEAQLASQRAIANAGLENTANLANATNTIDVNSTNAKLGQGQMTIDDQKQANSVIAALQAQSQVLQTDDAKVKNALLQQQIQAAIKSGDRSFLSQLVGTGLSLLGTIGGAIIGGPAGAIAGGAAGKFVGGAIGGEGNS